MEAHTTAQRYTCLVPLMWLFDVCVRWVCLRIYSGLGRLEAANGLDSRFAEGDLLMEDL